MIPYTHCLAVALCLCVAPKLESRELFTQNLKPVPEHITVPVQIGDNTVQMLFDTGASYTVLEDGVSNLITREFGQIISGYDASGKLVYFQKANCPNMKLGELKLSDECALSQSFDFFRVWMGLPVRGMFSVSSLHSPIIQLDYEKRRMTIADALPAVTGFQSLLLKVEENRLFVTMEIESIKIDCLIDTGFNHNIDLDISLFETFVASGCIKEEENAKVVDKALSGESRPKSGWFTRGEFMGRSLRGAGVNTRKKRGASIGLQWLTRFNTILDVRDSKFYYHDRNSKAPILVAGTLGVAFNFENNQMKVALLKPGGIGAAELAGLRLGDVLTTFGGVSTSHMDLGTVYELLDRATDQIECQVKDGGSEKARTVIIKFGKKKSVDYDFGK